MSTSKHELDLVERYLNEHFAPIARRLAHRIPDPEVRLVALRRTTRHIWHWAQAQGLDLDEPRAVVTVVQGGNGNGNGNGAKHGEEAAPDAAEPDAWASGGEPATPGQLAFLRDRGVAVPDGLTKAEASKLITTRIYGRKGARA